MCEVVIHNFISVIHIYNSSKLKRNKKKKSKRRESAVNVNNVREKEMNERGS